LVTCQNSNKHIIEEIVRQVGYLPELYEDAWSEKYKNGTVLILRLVLPLCKILHFQATCNLNAIGVLIASVILLRV